MNIHMIDHDLANRFSYLEIDEAVFEDAKYGWLFIRNELNAILDRFYEKLDDFGHEDKITDLHELKLKQYRHWANLFSCSYSREYVDQVRRSGIAHKNIRLCQADLAIGYAFMVDEMVKVLERRISDDPVRMVRTIRAVHKLASIDASIAFAAYEAVLID